MTSKVETKDLYTPIMYPPTLPFAIITDKRTWVQ